MVVTAARAHKLQAIDAVYIDYRYRFTVLHVYMCTGVN